MRSRTELAEPWLEAACCASVSHTLFALSESLSEAPRRAPFADFGLLLIGCELCETAVATTGS